MSLAIFCCSEIRPYRSQYLSHEGMFTSFMSWAAFPRQSARDSTGETKTDLVHLAPPFAAQLVRQKNYGPLESKKYFIPVQGTTGDFVEVVEDDLIQANFQKLNTYKNYKCEAHDKFYEVNIYQKDPVNKHHWRATLARPARDVDLGQ
ncbi:MFS multidrug transporter, partial [Metarhizium majus ARSEF 297]